MVAAVTAVMEVRAVTGVTVVAAGRTTTPIPARALQAARHRRAIRPVIHGTPSSATSSPGPGRSARAAARGRAAQRKVLTAKRDDSYCWREVREPGDPVTVQPGAVHSASASSFPVRVCTRTPTRLVCTPSTAALGGSSAPPAISSAASAPTHRRIVDNPGASHPQRGNAVHRGSYPCPATTNSLYAHRQVPARTPPPPQPPPGASGP
jgi:hypothetical protein